MDNFEKIRELERLKERVASLQREIESSQRNCRHVWNDPVYDPESHREASDFRLVGRGSDAWSEPTGYRDVTTPRWRRTCKVCGKIEYTKEQKPVKYAPAFPQ